MQTDLLNDVPKSNPPVVDRPARDRAVLMLRRFASGQMSNDTFEDEMPISADPSINAIWNTVWLYYSDMEEHTLTGRHRLHPDAKRMWIRWILFLDSECRYQWPPIQHPGNDPGAFEPSRFTEFLRQILGRRSLSDRIREFEATGDHAVWPFVSRSDYRKALRHPRRLAGRASK